MDFAPSSDSFLDPADPVAVRDFLLALPQVAEETPFGPEHLVYKIGGKMFALLSYEEMPPRLNLKADPERSLTLRDEFPDAILPGYHMNKRHWNTLILNGSLPRPLVAELIRHSLTLVIAGLPRSLQAKFAAAEPPLKESIDASRCIDRLTP